MRDAIIQNQYGYRRLGQRNHDLKQNRKLTRAIQLRRFLQAGIDRLHRCSHNDHIEGADRARQQDGPSRIIQTQTLNIQE